MSPPDNSDVYRGPIAWMARNSVAANVLMFVLLVGGVGMLFTSMKYEIFPEVELDRVLISVAYPGASPSEVEQGVVLAVEEAVRGLDGVKEVQSTAFEGSATIAVELLLGTDRDRALNDVKSAVDRITSFPEEAERPSISLANNRKEVVTLVLYGDLPESTLRQLAEDARRDLLTDPRITYVEVDGTRPLEISVEVPQERLREHGLTLDQVATAISRSSVELPAGGVKTRAGEILLRTDERRERGAEFGDIVIRSNPDGSELRVRDVANVRDSFRELDYAATFNGQPASMVRIFRAGDETPISVSDAVHEYLEEIEPTLPPTVNVTTWADSSEMYRERIDLLMRNGALGLTLVLLILGLFLEPRLAFWVFLGIPISFAGSLLFFPSAEVSINMISLFGFIVTLGMVVDDAIVVGEAIYYRRQHGEALLEAAVRGARDVAQPVIFSILTTCVAFAPMLFVPGVMGKFFRVVPITVISVLLISLVESLLVLPAHLSHRMPKLLQWILIPFTWPMSRIGPRGVGKWLTGFIDRRYRPFAHLTVRWRYLTMAGGFAVLLLTVGLVAGKRISFNFMPKIEGDVVTATLTMPVGTPVEETRRHFDRMIGEAQRTLRQVSPDEDISRGILAELGAASTLEAHPEAQVGNRASNLATIMVFMVPSDQRPIETGEFAERWRQAIGPIPGAETLTFRYQVGANPGSPIHVNLSHNDADTLEDAAARLARDLREYGGLRDIDSGVSTGKEQLNFKLTDLGRAHGLTEMDLARQVRAGFYGSEAVRQQRGRDEVRVFVRLPESDRHSLASLEDFIVRTPRGGEIPLGEAADISRGRAYTVIERIDGRRNLAVTADIVEGEANSTEVTQSLLANELPELVNDIPGLTFTLGGEQQRQSESMGALNVGFIMAMVVIFGMLAIAFRSYSQPLLIMLAIPFGLVGAVLGHILMGFDLSMMSMMGIVALSGVVVNDSLVLIVAINDYRREGYSVREAIVQGGARRFRPILLTSLTTFFGLLPMIFETSMQARFLIPMAISLGYGVLVATLITLVLIPAAYAILEDTHGIISKGWHKLTGEPPRSSRPSSADAPAAES